MFLHLAYFNVLFNYMPLDIKIHILVAFHLQLFHPWLHLVTCPYKHGALVHLVGLFSRPLLTFLAPVIFPRSCTCSYCLYWVPLSSRGDGNFISLPRDVMLLPLLSDLLLLVGFLLAIYQLLLCLHTYDKYCRLRCLWVTFGGWKSLQQLYDEC